MDLNAHNCYIEMAKELTEHKNPEDIISALLQYSFPDELNEKRYVEIEEAVVDKKGKTRLFVTQGKQDGLTQKKLVTYIKDISNIASEKIRDVQILDKYSFVTLPFREAEILLTSFKRRKKGSGLFITKAKKMRT